MAEISGLKTLRQVVEEYMFLTKKDAGEEADYFRMYQLAIRALKKIKLFHLRGFATVLKCTVSAIKTIDLPSDYLSFIGVAVPVDGEYWFLTEKGKMVFSQTGGTLDEDAGEGVDVLDGYYMDYQSSGAINREGYYLIDEKNSRIILNSLESTTTEVYLLYYSTGINASDTTYIPDRATEAIHAYMRLNDAYFSDELNKVPILEDQYNKRIDELRYLDYPRLTEFRDALYDVMNPLPQR